MSQQLKTKIVVITGGVKGVGYAVAEEFLSEGAEIVIFIDIDENQGTETAKLLNSKHGVGKAIFFMGVVAKDLDRLYSEIVHKYQNIDILVNNAGISDEIFLRRNIEVNAIAPMEWTMKFLENMRTDKGGQGGTILNMASIYGYVVDQHAPFYKASKHAVMGFTRTVGHVKNYEVTGVRVMALCPGRTNTDMILNVAQNEAFAFHEVKVQDILDSLPSQEKEEVAKAAVELLAIGQSGSAWSIISGELQAVDA